jgi:hypothetical protein
MPLIACLISFDLCVALDLPLLGKFLSVIIVVTLEQVDIALFLISYKIFLVIFVVFLFALVFLVEVKIVHILQIEKKN